MLHTFASDFHFSRIQKAQKLTSFSEDTSSKLDSIIQVEEL